MRVCGACCLRDISHSYPGRDIDLFGMDPRLKWLVIPDEALRTLKSHPPFFLVGPDSERVQVQRADLHNTFESGSKAFHVVPEAVRDCKIDLCSE